MKVKNYKGQLVRMIQQKVDGWQYRVITGDKCQCLSRSKDVDVWEKLFRCHDIASKIVHLPEGCEFIVEFHAPGVPATSVPTMIADNDPRLVMTILMIDLWCFQDYKDRPWSEVQKVCEFHGLEAVTTHYFDEPHRLSEDEVKMYQEKAERMGIEGWVTRIEHQVDLFKIKKVRTIDVIVTDWGLGTNKNAARLGYVEIGVYSPDGFKSLGRCGIGFSDEDRVEYCRNVLTGKVIEVAYDDLAAKGKLKFARFLRIRDDKPAGECTEDQL